MRGNFSKVSLVIIIGILSLFISLSAGYAAIEVKQRRDFEVTNPDEVFLEALKEIEKNMPSGFDTQRLSKNQYHILAISEEGAGNFGPAGDVGNNFLLVMVDDGTASDTYYNILYTMPEMRVIHFSIGEYKPPFGWLEYDDYFDWIMFQVAEEYEYLFKESIAMMLEEENQWQEVNERRDFTIDNDREIIQKALQVIVEYFFNGDIEKMLEEFQDSKAYIHTIDSKQDYIFSKLVFVMIENRENERPDCYYGAIFEFPSLEMKSVQSFMLYQPFDQYLRMALEDLEIGELDGGEEDIGPEIGILPNAVEIPADSKEPAGFRNIPWGQALLYLRLKNGLSLMCSSGTCGRQ